MCVRVCRVGLSPWSDCSVAMKLEVMLNAADKKGKAQYKKEAVESEAGKESEKEVPTVTKVDGEGDGLGDGNAEPSGGERDPSNPKVAEAAPKAAEDEVKDEVKDDSMKELGLDEDRSGSPDLDDLGLGDDDDDDDEDEDEEDEEEEAGMSAEKSKDPNEGAIALVGGVGCDYVSRVLSTFAPQEAVMDIQDKTKVRDARYNPVSGLLQQMGKTRTEVNKSLLSSFTHVLLKRIHSIKEEEALLELLEVSFIYIRIPEMKTIPIAVLERLKAVPNTFLKQLSADRAVFIDLPESVQRQVWELDKSLLQQHVSPLIHKYIVERATVVACLNMNQPETPSAKGSAAQVQVQVPSIQRQSYRQESQALQKITSIINKSNKIYKYIVNLCLTLYRESEKSFMSKEELAYCTFRSQLLMGLHDSMNEIRQGDACHRLAWVLDVAIKDKNCGDKRIHELKQIFLRFDNLRGKKRSHGTRGGGSDPPLHDGGGSTSRPDETNVLGEMGMILRDPPVFFFLAREALKRLEAVALAQKMPRQDANLAFLSRLLQIATESRNMLRDKSFKFHKVDQGLVRDFYPRLCSSLMDRKLALAGRQVDSRAVDARVVEWVTNNAVAQAMYQVFVMDSLVKHHAGVAELGLMTIAMSLKRVSSKALVEWTPFMYSLAQILITMIQVKGQGAAGTAVDPSGSLWELAVDQILVKGVNHDFEVHRSLLKLVDLAATPTCSSATPGPGDPGAGAALLGPKRVARYLEAMLEASEKSRKRFRKRNPNSEAGDGVVKMYRDVVEKLGLVDKEEVLGPKLLEYVKWVPEQVVTAGAGAGKNAGGGSADKMM